VLACNGFPGRARLPGVESLLAKWNDQQQRQHPDVQRDHLDNNECQVGQRAALAMILQDGEEEHPFPHVDHGVQQHQKGADCLLQR
jgi:hypothetical protein